MLARYTLSSCVLFSVRPCVRLSQAGIVSKQLDESSWFWLGGFLLSIPLCVIWKYGYLRQLGYFALGLCPKLRQGKSIALLTILAVVVDVEVVDYTYTTIDESSTVTL